METATRPTDDAEQDAAQRQSPRPRAAFNAWRICVMLVDDDAADAGLVVDVLKRHSNVGSVYAFPTADAALTELTSRRCEPDLIFIDINMPKLDGFKFIEAVNAIRHLRATPLVLLTTSRFARDVEKARHSSACAYIVKPDSFDDLKKRIDHAITQAISGKWS